MCVCVSFDNQIMQVAWIPELSLVTHPYCPLLLAIPEHGVLYPYSGEVCTEFAGR